MLRKTGIILSIVLGLILTAAAVCNATSLIFPETDNKFISFISDNWLIIIFKLHAKIINPGSDPLREIHVNDIVIVALFILICLCLYFTLKRKNKIWFMTALSLLIFGIIILSVTHLAGRSSYMASGLIISLTLLSGGSQKMIAGLTGILANSLLLIGDFTVGSELMIIPVLFGLGYILDIMWIFLIALIFIRTE